VGGAARGKGRVVVERVVHPLRTDTFETGGQAGRDVGVDVVRGLALLSMYVAHTASRSDDRLAVLVANLVTAALFATLVGAGAALAARRPRGLRASVAGPLVRGAALVVLGLALVSAGSSVIVILVHLGLLTWLVALLVRCPTWSVAGVGVVLLAVSPVLLTSLAPLDARLTAEGPHLLGLLLDLTATGDTYRLTSLLGWAALGVVLVRTLLAGRGGVRPATMGALALGAAASITAVTGRPVPYSGTHVELVVDALLASGVLLLGVGLTRLARGHGLGWLADLGRMTLTLYTLQVLALALLEQRLRPGQPPYGTEVLAALVAGSVAVALAWNAVPLARRWGRGPLEGGVEMAVRVVAGARSPVRTPSGRS